MKHFIITWYRNVGKYQDIYVRKNIITSTDIRSALGAFQNGFGSFNKNTVQTIEQVLLNDKGEITEYVQTFEPSEYIKNGRLL